MALGTAIVNAGTCVAGQVCFINGERKFTDYAPRFTLHYKPNAATLVYGQFAKGSKAGLHLFARTDVNDQSRRYAEIQNLIWADPFTRVNANLGLRGSQWRFVWDLVQSGRGFILL